MADDVIPKHPRFAFTSVSVLLASISLSLHAQWPQFRGPTGDGHVLATVQHLPLHWSETNHITWKTPIPYKGWSTPAIAEGRAWLTTATEDGHDFFVICVDAKSGQMTHNRKLFHCDNPEPLGNNVNCYATPSPVAAAGKVFVHFGSYGTACLDAGNGKVLWERQDLPCRHYRGPSSSPILFQDLLILTFDGADLQYLVALNKNDGKTVWKTDRSVAWNDENVQGQMARDGDLRKAHSTPVLARVRGQFQLLSSGAKAAYAYDPATGRELWRVGYDAWSAAPMPLYDEENAYLITGRGHTELWAVRFGGAGDVTQSNVVWKYQNSVAQTASPILVNGLLMMVNDDGALSCLEAAAGTQLWRERIGGKYAASPIYGGGHVYFCNQEGKTTIVKAARTFELAATNTLATGLMASPAVAENALFLRTKTHLYRIEE